MEKTSNFNKKQEKVALQWAIVVNAFISYLFLLGKFTVPLFWSIRGSVKGASNNKMLNLVHRFGQHSL